MPKPIGAGTDMEILIGQRVETLAGGDEQPETDEAITGSLERADGDMTPAACKLIHGEPTSEKWVVVPELSAITEGLDRLEGMGDHYELREEYLNQTFGQVIDILRRQLGDLPDTDERKAHVESFLSDVIHPDKMDKRNFFYFRLGEYCVNQCY